MREFKNKRLFVIAFIAVIVLVMLLLNNSSSKTTAACGPYRTDKSIKIGGSEFKAEIVQTPGEQATGLSNRPCIEPDRAMMFVFDKPGQYAIWMKNMKFAIDIIWVTPDGSIVGIERGVAPDTYPDSFANREKNAQYIIEMRSGRTGELKLELGDKVTL